MYKAVISGYYGFNNIGDESILKAVVENLRMKIPDIEITVLSQNPQATAEKYGVKAVPRMSVFKIASVLKSSDLLISGGGSLLQDVTSKKSILYYLMIMWLAKFFRKKVFIYSQGIGPIVSKINRRLTAWTLKKADGIVVRDGSSKELLKEIGIPAEDVFVATDPVVRVAKADLAPGKKILEGYGVQFTEGKLRVGWAIKERKLDSDFMDEVCESIQALKEEYSAEVILIPFHHSEDVVVIEEICSRLDDDVVCIKEKYLTDEMLSIIGNMDVLVGVRLHSIIYAAIMNVPMIAISYDIKVNAFMHSINMKAMCSTYDFSKEYFLEEFEKTLHNKEQIKQNIESRIKSLVEKLDENERQINELRNGKRR